MKTAWLAAMSLGIVLVMPAAQGASLQLSFEHEANGRPLVLDSLRYELPSKETYSIERLSYLLSGFALQREDGSWVELPDEFAWIDIAQRRASKSIRNVPAGEYRALRFAVGLDPKTNAGDSATFPAEHPLNPNLNGLHWSWQGGYIFLAMEGRYRRSDGALSGYSYHLARDPNRTPIALPLKLQLRDAEIGGARVVLNADVLLCTPRPISFEKDGSSTHSRDNDEIATALRANLAAAFRIEITPSLTAAAIPAVKPIDLPAHFTPYSFTINGRFPIPALPRDNPLIVQRAALGERLFHEPLLSRNGEISCATCHDREHAFADSDPVSTGIEGRHGTRNAMPLFNLAWKSSYFWDGRAPNLRSQALLPIQDHAEMDESISNVVTKLARTTDYPRQFEQAFASPAITPERIGLAIENYLLTLTSNDSKFDRAMRGEVELSAPEKRGFELFFTEYEPRTGQYGADCFHCHAGPLFSDHQFHNNGLISYGDVGRFGVTGLDRDRGKFATPSLRNVAVTAPYMHDGRFSTLEEVLDHYTKGVQRTSTLDPNLAKHPVSGLPLSTEDRAAIIAFLRSLTDEKFVGSYPRKQAAAGGDSAR